MAAVLCEHRVTVVEPVRGFEPPLQPYKGRVLPLNYTGLVGVDGIEPSSDGVSDRCLTAWLHSIGCGGWNCTSDLRHIRPLPCYLATPHRCCGWIRTSASQGNSPVSYRSTTQQRMGLALISPDTDSISHCCSFVLVDRTGIEPVPRRCKRHMLPLPLTAHEIVYQGHVL